MIQIVNVSQNWAIGKQGRLLIHIPADMRRFRELTSGKVCIMGSTTLEDRAAGQMTELIYVRTPEEALLRAGAYPKDDVFVIGGASIYRLFLPWCDTCLVTHNDFPSDGADTFYPDLDATGEWRMTEQGAPNDFEGTEYRYCRYERI